MQSAALKITDLRLAIKFSITKTQKQWLLESMWFLSEDNPSSVSAPHRTLNWPAFTLMFNTKISIRTCIGIKIPPKRFKRKKPQPEERIFSNTSFWKPFNNMATETKADVQHRSSSIEMVSEDLPWRKKSNDLRSTRSRKQSRISHQAGWDLKIKSKLSTFSLI